MARTKAKAKPAARKPGRPRTKVAAKVDNKRGRKAKAKRKVVLEAEHVDALLGAEGKRPRKAKRKAKAQRTSAKAAVFHLTASVSMMTGRLREVHEQLRGLAVDVAPKLAMVDELKRQVDDYRYRLDRLEDRALAKPVELPALVTSVEDGHVLSNMTASQVATLLAHKLSADEAEVAVIE